MLDDSRARSQRDDTDLARKAADGDTAARRALADRLLDRVRATVRYISANDRDRDDWTQMAMLEILSSIGSYKGKSSLETWADRITVRTALRHIKRRRTKEQKVAIDSQAGPRREDGPEDEHDRLFLRRHLALSFENLDAKYRSILVLKLVHGYRDAEIAQMTRTSLDTVKGRLKRGRLKLRKKIMRDPVLSEWVRTRM